MKLIYAIGICISSFSCFAQQAQKTDRIITTEKGDKIAFEALKERTVHIANSGANKTIMTGAEKPVLLNGKAIYYFIDHPADKVSYAQVMEWAKDHNRLTAAIDAALKEEKAKLPTGLYKYELKDMVIDEKGSILYYRTDGLIGYRTGSTNRVEIPFDVPVKIATAIEQKIKTIVERYKYKPLLIANIATPYWNQYTYCVNDNCRSNTIHKTLSENIRTYIGDRKSGK